MLIFKQKVVLVLLSLIAITALFAWLFSLSFFYTDSLLPKSSSVYPWQLGGSGDGASGGNDAVSIIDSDSQITFEYELSPDVQFPWIRLFISFDDMGVAENLVNLTPYKGITFEARCSDDNTLSFATRTVDPGVTTLNDPGSYRYANQWFPCRSQWAIVDVDFRYLKVPRWWLEDYDVDRKDNSYSLDQVVALGFSGSHYGPVGKKTRVEIRELKLHGYNWWALVTFAFAVAVLWISFLIWLFRLQANSLSSDIQRKLEAELEESESPVDYQELEIESRGEKAKSSVLRYMEENFSNSDLSLELLTQELGLNHKKVNEILKGEVQSTFSTYLNKLRTGDAARRLRETPEMNISEIAQLVGYKNVTYFNKLFKQEYGCSPKEFKQNVG